MAEWSGAKEPSDPKERKALVMTGMVLLALALVGLLWDNPPELVEVLWFLALVGGPILIYMGFVNPEFLCMDCGQFVGTLSQGLPAVCSRCGANRYTTDKVEPGKKFRER